MTRVYNFGAGPAMLPEVLLKEIQEEFLDWQHLGMSILEVGHRTSEFMALLHQAECSLRALLGIPKQYHILFLGGAARMQFSMIPMNLMAAHQSAGYIVTGLWSQMAYKEAQLLKNAYCLVDESAQGFVSIPRRETLSIKADSAYVYYTPNETVNGVRMPYVPNTQGIPLIADMTSCLLSEPLDVTQYGLIFAGAQKNIANAGMTIVIIREDLLERIPAEIIPSMLNYKTQVTHHSLYATPPVFNCYVAAKMFSWIQQQGGVDALFRNNCLKAAKLYQYLDNSDFYCTEVQPEARSIMNVCFTLKNQAEQEFLAAAQRRGLCALKGHRTVGGIRASLYNAMPISGVDALIDFMNDFAGIS